MARPAGRPKEESEAPEALPGGARELKGQSKETARGSEGPPALELKYGVDARKRDRAKETPRGRFQHDARTETGRSQNPVPTAPGAGVTAPCAVRRARTVKRPLTHRPGTVAGQAEGHSVTPTIVARLDSFRGPAERRKPSE